MFSQEEWDHQVGMLLESCNVMNVHASTKVFESGCGGGAFLDSLGRLCGCKELFGCDQASGCVDIASRRLKNGMFGWDMQATCHASTMAQLIFPSCLE